MIMPVLILLIRHHLFLPDYFTDKILSIKLGLCSLKSDRGIESAVSDLSRGSSLTEFNPVSPYKTFSIAGRFWLKGMLTRSTTKPFDEELCRRIVTYCY